MRVRARDAAGFVLPAVWLVGLLVVPLAGLMWLALTDDPRRFLSDPSVQAAVRLSLGTTALSAFIILALGTPLAWIMARWTFPGRSLLQLLVDLPIVLPPMVAGIALLAVFGRHGWLGEVLAGWGMTLPFTTAAVVVSQVFVGGPFYVRAARVGFAGIDRAVLEAAVVDGASEFQLFGHIVLPGARRALISGLVLAWARALGEFGATIFFAGNREGATQTMPLAIFIGFESDLNMAVGLSFVLLLASVGVLGLTSWAGDQRDS